MNEICWVYNFTTWTKLTNKNVFTSHSMKKSNSVFNKLDQNQMFKNKAFLWISSIRIKKTYTLTFRTKNLQLDLKYSRIELYADWNNNYIILCKRISDCLDVISKIFVYRLRKAISTCYFEHVHISALIFNVIYLHIVYIGDKLKITRMHKLMYSITIYILWKIRLQSIHV